MTISKFGRGKVTISKFGRGKVTISKFGRGKVRLISKIGRGKVIEVSSGDQNKFPINFPNIRYIQPNLACIKPSQRFDFTFQKNLAVCRVCYVLIFSCVEQSVNSHTKCAKF